MLTQPYTRTCLHTRSGVLSDHPPAVQRPHWLGILRQALLLRETLRTRRTTGVYAYVYVCVYEIGCVFVYAYICLDTYMSLLYLFCLSHTYAYADKCIHNIHHHRTATFLRGVSSAHSTTSPPNKPARCWLPGWRVRVHRCACQSCRTCGWC
jgi:hypothetical protein